MKYGAKIAVIEAVVELSKSGKLIQWTVRQNRSFRWENQVV